MKQITSEMAKFVELDFHRDSARSSSLSPMRTQCDGLLAERRPLVSAGGEFAQQSPEAS